MVLSAAALAAHACGSSQSPSSAKGAAIDEVGGTGRRCDGVRGGWRMEDAVGGRRMIRYVEVVSPGASSSYLLRPPLASSYLLLHRTPRTS
eukprot:5909226-Pyramimonas_sp.AAC.1